MKRILIVKTSALGDIIHVYPVVNYLRGKFPAAQIDWVVEAPYVDLVQSHRGINLAIPIATKKWRKAPLSRETFYELKKCRQTLREVHYDLAIDLQGNVKSGLVLSQVRSPIKLGFGWASAPEKPNLLFTNRWINPPANGNIRQDYLAVISSYFKEEIPEQKATVSLKITSEQEYTLQTLMQNPVFAKRPKVMVCAGSAWQNKQMTPEGLGNFLTLLQKHLNAAFLFAWGSPGEKLIAEDLQQKFPQESIVIEKMSLSMLQNAMGMCDLVIAMDSLPLHLAGTTKTPSFSVFGASSAQKYKPLGEHHAAFQGACPYSRTFVKRCPILRTCKTGACIRNLEGTETFEFFKTWWEGQRRKRT